MTSVIEPAPTPPSVNKDQDEPTAETVEALEESTLSFVRVCQDSWSEAAERVENGRRLLDSVRNVIRDLEQLEKQHSVNLRKLANKLEVPDTETSTCEAAVSAFRSDLVNRAHHSMQFAMSIRSDVLDSTLEPAIANHASVFTQIKFDAIASSKTIADLRLKHAKALQAVSITKKAALRATLRAQDPDLTLTQHRVRMHLIALEAAQEAQLAYNSYLEAVAALNDAQQKYRKQLDAMLNALEDMDKKRIECLRDSLMKMYIYRTAQCKNTEYDTNTAVGITKLVDASKDITDYLTTLAHAADANEDFSGTLKDEPILSWPEIEASCLQSTPLADRSAHLTHRNRTKGANNDLNPAAAVRQFLKQTNLDQVVQQAQAGLRELGTTLAGKDDATLLNYPNKRDRLKQSLREEAEVETLEHLLEDVARVDAKFSKESVLLPDMEHDYESLLQLIWQSAFVEIFNNWGDKGLLSVIEGFGASINRLQFCMAFMKVAALHKFRLDNMDSFHALCHLCHGLLNHCESSNDFWCGRIMMLSCHQIYVEGLAGMDPQKTVANWALPQTQEDAEAMQSQCDASKTASVDSASQPSILPEGSTLKKSGDASNRDTRVIWRLTRGLYEHPFWNRVAFWEEAFLLTLSEDLQRRVLIEAWKTQNLVLNRDSTDGLDIKEKQFKLRNPYCQSLCLFAYHMTSFGIKHNQILSMIEKLCVKYGFGADFAVQMVECLGQRKASHDSKSAQTTNNTPSAPQSPKEQDLKASES